MTSLASVIRPLFKVQNKLSEFIRATEDASISKRAKAYSLEVEASELTVEAEKAQKIFNTLGNLLGDGK